MKSKTVAEKRHMSRVAGLGCIVCRNNGYPNSPATVHHINSGAMGKRSGHCLVIPLCPEHHQSGGVGVAIHASKQAFETLYGDELHLLDQTLELLA